MNLFAFAHTCRAVVAETMKSLIKVQFGSLAPRFTDVRLCVLSLSVGFVSQVLYWSPYTQATWFWICPYSSLGLTNAALAPRTQVASPLLTWCSLGS